MEGAIIMMKVLMVDDEIQIRKGLRLKVNWEEEGFHIVEEASNGQEAMDILKKKKIDVLITDMKMPVMDGIELVKQCQQECAHIRIIALSGYSDFEYVRNSMKHGVKDYLLKPVAPDELIAELRKIRKDIEVEKNKQLELNRINLLAHSHLEEIQEQYLLHLVKDDWLQIPLLIDRLHQLRLDAFTEEGVEAQFITVEMRGSNRERLKELWLPFKMLCNEIANEQDGKTYLFHDPSYTNTLHFLHIINTEKTDSTDQLVGEIQQTVNRYLNLETVIGIGYIVKGITEFRNGYISSLLSWSQSKLGLQSQVIDQKTTSEEILNVSPDFEKKLTNAIENVHLQSFKERLNTVLGETDNQSMFSFSFMANRVLFILSSLVKKYDINTDDIQRMVWECQESIRKLNSNHKVIDGLIQLGQVIIDHVRKTRCSNGKLIESICQYLEQHYGSEISLTSVSELFYINSTYLSETFKRQVGQNFSDYLVKLRISKAKQFLEDEQLKIIDVANLVGFSNSGYFSTVFKKHVGQTPVEFRQSINLESKRNK